MVNRKRVLITDDSGYMRQVIRKYLEPEGFEIIAEARNGIEAIKLFQLHQPELVTMDISMHHLNGIQTTERIISISPGAKIIVISALGEARLIKQAISAGASDFIIKPFSEKRLLLSVSSILK